MNTVCAGQLGKKPSKVQSEERSFSVRSSPVIDLSAKWDFLLAKWGFDPFVSPLSAPCGLQGSTWKACQLVRRQADKAHTLMQAIARAESGVPGLDFGLIVDYNGSLNSLREALASMPWVTIRPATTTFSFLLSSGFKR